MTDKERGDHSSIDFDHIVEESEKRLITEDAEDTLAVIIERVKANNPDNTFPFEKTMLRNLSIEGNGWVHVGLEGEDPLFSPQMYQPLLTRTQYIAKIFVERCLVRWEPTMAIRLFDQRFAWKFNEENTDALPSTPFGRLDRIIKEVNKQYAETHGSLPQRFPGITFQFDFLNQRAWVQINHSLNKLENNHLQRLIKSAFAVADRMQLKKEGVFHEWEDTDK